MQDIQVNTGDTVAIGSIVLSFMGFLPAIAAGFAILWYVVQITESKTGKAFIKRFFGKKRRG